MSDSVSEFELIWDPSAPQPVAVREPPKRKFKITRRITPLQNDHVWHQYRTLSLGRLFKEKLLTITCESDETDSGPWQPTVETPASLCSVAFNATETESLYLCLLNIIKKYGDLSPAVSKADALSYVEKVLRISHPEEEGSAATKDTVTSWRLICTVKSVRDPKPSRQVPEEGQFYCSVGLLPKEQQTSRAITKHTLQNWAATIPVQVHCTSMAAVCPVWNEALEFPVDDITRFLLVVELWQHILNANRRRSLNISFFNGNATRSAKAQEKLIGRVFLPLQKIALEGEDRELPLDPKKPGGASVIIHLSVKGSQEHIATEADIQDHRLLHSAIVTHESQALLERKWGGATAAGPHLLQMEGASAMLRCDDTSFLGGTPNQLASDMARHSFAWGEELSILGRQLLMAHASWHGIDAIQLAAIELRVLTDCHKAKAMFAMGPFLSHLDQILQKIAGIYEGIPLSSREEQSQELHTSLLGLDAYVQDMLHNHLIMVDLASPVQGTQWLTGLLMTMKKIYDVMPYVQRLPAGQQDYQEVLQGCVKEQSGDKAIALKKLSVDCYEKCSKVQLYVVDTFEKFGVDYYLIFIQAVDKELHRCSQELIVSDSSVSTESSIVYYHAYLACRKISKSIISTTQSLCGVLTIQCCHLWFEPLVGHWFSTACNRCQERIEMTVKLDQFVPITEQVEFSSSAVDTPIFLMQIVQFWQEMDWPVEKNTEGYMAELFCCIYSCAEYYADILYKKVACSETFKSTGPFVASKELCIALNNMRHVSKELCSMLSFFDVSYSCDQAHDKACDQAHDKACDQAHDKACDQAHDKACDQAHDKACDQACGSNKERGHTGEDDSGKSLPKCGRDNDISLKDNREQKLHNKITFLATEASKKLDPHIKRLVNGFMATLQDTAATEIVDPLCEYLAKSLMTLDKWLHSDLFQIIIASLWENTLQALDTLLLGLHKRTTFLTPQKCHNVLGEISSFFHSNGEGLSGESLHTQHYKAIVKELELMCLSTRDLILRCCADLAEQQAKAVGSPEHRFGELTLSVGYIKEKAVVEVTVLQAKLADGKRNSKGSSHTLVYAWLLPQLVFTECAKKKHKTHAEKGTLELVYNHTFLLYVSTASSEVEDIMMDDTILLVGVYSTNTKHLIGLGVVPCREIPILPAEQRLLDDTSPRRMRRDLPLIHVDAAIGGVYSELGSRHSHDHEASKFYRYLRKKLHMVVQLRAIHTRPLHLGAV